MEHIVKIRIEKLPEGYFWQPPKMCRDWWRRDGTGFGDHGNVARDGARRLLEAQAG